MGKLNIAHHKSYHPYRLDNIERVRKDEEEAQKNEEVQEQRMMLADSEARIQLLRDRAGLGAGSSKSRKREEQKEEERLLKEATTRKPVAAAPATHINFFEDLEQADLVSVLQRSQEADKLRKAKGKGPVSGETDKGIPLAPNAKDLRPWYTSSKNLKEGRLGEEMEGEGEIDERKKQRDLSTKSLSDPLTSINRQLASRFPQDRPRDGARRLQSQQHPNSRSNNGVPTVDPTVKPELGARLSRESSERQRALELIRRKRREVEGSETPSTVHGGAGYGDQFNRREVEEAHAFRQRPNYRHR